MSNLGIYSDDALCMAMLPTIAERSKDPSTKTSCVIVTPDGAGAIYGFNSFPENVVDHKPERWERPEKYFWVEHAERNAIYRAARAGIALDGSTMYLSWLPCMDCGRAIIQSGITRLVCDKKMVDLRRNDPKWKPDFDRVLTLLEEGCVRVEFWED